MNTPSTPAWGLSLRGRERLPCGQPAARAVVVVLAMCLLAGCAGDPVPIPTGLSPPAADLMARCPLLPDIPADEGNPETRRRYYATTRQSYGQCSDRVAGLQAYARTVAPNSKPEATPEARVARKPE